jgi:hypothetical protein
MNFSLVFGLRGTFGPFICCTVWNEDVSYARVECLSILRNGKTGSRYLNVITSKEKP